MSEVDIDAEKNLSPIRGLSEKEVEALYYDYAKFFGDCEAPKEISAFHGEWELVAQRPATNGYCGRFLGFKICNRVELHKQANLEGVSHAGEVFTHKVHRSCNKPQCRVCCFSGWACKEAGIIAQRIEKASKGYVDVNGKKHMGLGLPQHIVVSPLQSDWGLAEFHNDKFLDKVKKILFDVGVEGGCSIFHGFSYHNFQESVEKDVLFGWDWHPHVHVIGFIVGGYGKCRFCSKTLRRFRSRGGKMIEEHGNSLCLNCDGFEARVRRSYEKNKYIIKCEAERASVFGTAWYQLNHCAIRVRSK